MLSDLSSFQESPILLNMAERVVDAVKELLKCSVCLSQLFYPKTLPCEHSFCAQCLADTLLAKVIKDGEAVIDEKGSWVGAERGKIDNG